MEAQEVYFKHDDEDFSPPAVLLLYVSETAAAAAQQQLLKLCVEPDETANTGKKAYNVLYSTFIHSSYFEKRCMCMKCYGSLGFY